MYTQQLFNLENFDFQTQKLFTTWSNEGTLGC